ncbi:protein of unknown function DUF369 [Spirochaeta thermophila DSM 6578]|uniref:Cyclophilin TM1367-like domain-containing protein n=1 Tax=Winmispira thermophila (strain ATCC 700085 / DSM 6578 / Z-1203) TaxID=869211 RepID=G0GEP9_WINT7|nr:cyclophilin-like fold protein [Spirochaeta thermophila]AEJ60737.1 protein of unknown function DUF369 [Spirochaeta thermophila DSM 6578]
MKVRLVIDEEVFEAELFDTPLGRAIAALLPVEGRGAFWGSEIYFPIALRRSLERPQELVQPGDLAYWPGGPSFCIFWGPTPISGPGEIRPASEVEVFGRITSDLAGFDRVKRPVVRVERVE